MSDDEDPIGDALFELEQARSAFSAQRIPYYGLVRFEDGQCLPALLPRTGGGWIAVMFSNRTSANVILQQLPPEEGWEIFELPKWMNVYEYFVRLLEAYEVRWFLLDPKELAGEAAIHSLDRELPVFRKFAEDEAPPAAVAEGDEPSTLSEENTDNMADKKKQADDTARFNAALKEVIAAEREVEAVEAEIKKLPNEEEALRRYMEAMSKFKKDPSDKNKKDLSSRLAELEKARSAPEQKKRAELEKKKAEKEKKRDELQRKLDEERLYPE